MAPSNTPVLLVPGSADTKAMIAQKARNNILQIGVVNLSARITLMLGRREGPDMSSVTTSAA